MNEKHYETDANGKQGECKQIGLGRLSGKYEIPNLAGIDFFSPLPIREEKCIFIVLFWVTQKNVYGTARRGMGTVAVKLLFHLSQIFIPYKMHKKNSDFNPSNTKKTWYVIFI